MSIFGEDVNLQKELAKAEAGDAAEPVAEPAAEPATEPAEPTAEPASEPAAPEPAAEPSAAPSAAKPDKMVPLAALHEARNELKELKKAQEKQRQDEEKRFADLRARMEALQPKPKAEEPAPVPDFNADPANHLKVELETLKKNQETQNNQLARERLQQNLANRITLSEKSFAAEHPDYWDAAKHFHDTMQKNLDAYGVADKGVRENAYVQEIHRIAINALQAGKEPAEMVYSLAKNFGFTGKKESGKAAGAADDGAKAEVAKDTAKLDSIAKGQDAAKSLGSGGRSEAGALTLESLSKMDDDDFAAVVSDEKKWKSIGKMMH